MTYTKIVVSSHQQTRTIIKTLTNMKTPTNYTENFAKKFKASYIYKMGGTQTVVMPNGEKFTFDDREYYSGRGNKYNSSIRHENKGEVIVTIAQVKAQLKMIADREKSIKLAAKIRKETAKRVENARKAGVYSIKTESYGMFVELSEDEIYGRFFDAKRLASTLKIAISDVKLLFSTGKTYVFAKSEDGNTYELYHSSLSCNYLSISVTKVDNERVAEFNSTEWQSAPYAGLLGQTNAHNHFVC